MPIYTIGCSEPESSSATILFHEKEFSQDDFAKIVLSLIPEAYGATLDKKTAEHKTHAARLEEAYDPYDVYVSFCDIEQDVIARLCAEHGFRVMTVQAAFSGPATGKLASPSRRDATSLAIAKTLREKGFGNRDEEKSRWNRT